MLNRFPAHALVPVEVRLTPVLLDLNAVVDVLISAARPLISHAGDPVVFPGIQHREHVPVIDGCVDAGQFRRIIRREDSQCLLQYGHLRGIRVRRSNKRINSGFGCIVI